MSAAGVGWRRALSYTAQNTHERWRVVAFLMTLCRNFERQFRTLRANSTLQSDAQQQAFRVTMPPVMWCTVQRRPDI